MKTEQSQTVRIIPKQVSELTEISINTIPQVPALALAFVIGYVVNAISSWSECILFWTWCGKPSDRMLTGNSIRKVKFYQQAMVKEMLTKESENDKPSNDELFSIAMRHAISSTKVTDFNGLYAFSRSILISIIFASIILNIHFWINWSVMIISILLVVVLWIRSKQNGYYYVREVLNTYLSVKTSVNSGK
ncbi:MAG: hypothetical protein L6422_00995 [Candidatus Marinimicrobia bacterium]|nr:hypothetical protein [Candidatus Neomarinimicrobiota bacterium]